MIHTSVLERPGQVRIWATTGGEHEASGTNEHAQRRDHHARWPRYQLTRRAQHEFSRAQHHIRPVHDDRPADQLVKRREQENQRTRRLPRASGRMTRPPFGETGSTDRERKATGGETEGTIWETRGPFRESSASRREAQSRGWTG